ncbi:TetR/AcrR family transcriptional regulator [soil metagenome]
MTRPLRKDAAERRIALLDAAASAFAEYGFDVPLDVIAERAGVGRATLYRNFADRGELAAAVFAAQLDDLDARTRERGDDPHVFFWFVDELAVLLKQNAGLDAALREAHAPEALTPMRERLVEAGRAPLARAQTAGLVRADLTTQDIRAIAMILGAGASRPDPAEREAFGIRIRALLLDGLRVRPPEATA